MFNPLEWVLQPVRCAFEPRQDVVNAATARINDKLRNTQLVKLVNVLGAAGTDLGLSSGGCMGPVINLSIYGYEYVGYPLQACSGPPATLATLSRIFTAVGIWIACMLSISKSVGNVFQFGGKGGDES